MFPFEEDLKKFNPNLENELSLITDIFFLYDKSSIVMPKFVTEFKKWRFIRQILIFWWGSSAQFGINTIKPKAKTNKQCQKTSISYQLTKINGTASGLVANKLHDWPDEKEIGKWKLSIQYILMD